MHWVIKNLKEGQIVIHSHKSKNEARLWAPATPDYLLSSLKEDRGLYEVLSHYPYKVYFDIDHDAAPDPEFLNKIKTIIDEYFPDGDFAISGSVTPDKTSYHFVSNHYFIESKEDRDTLQTICKYLRENVEYAFDPNPYSDNRFMKCVNQSKAEDNPKDKRVQQVIEQDNLKKHLITCYMRNDYYPMPEFEEPQHEEVNLEINIIKAKKPLNLGSLPVITSVSGKTPLMHASKG